MRYALCALLFIDWANFSMDAPGLRQVYFLNNLTTSIGSLPLTFLRIAISNVKNVSLRSKSASFFHT